MRPSWSWCKINEIKDQKPFVRCDVLGRFRMRKLAQGLLREDEWRRFREGESESQHYGGVRFLLGTGERRAPCGRPRVARAPEPGYKNGLAKGLARAVFPVQPAIKHWNSRVSRRSGRRGRRSLPIAATTKVGPKTASTGGRAAKHSADVTGNVRLWQRTRQGKEGVLHLSSSAPDGAGVVRMLRFPLALLAAFLFVHFRFAFIAIPRYRGSTSCSCRVALRCDKLEVFISRGNTTIVAYVALAICSGDQRSLVGTFFFSLRSSIGKRVDPGGGHTLIDQ